MRTAIITDTHSNLHALERVLEDIDQAGVDRILCLGDVVDGGAFPRECIAIVQDRCEHTLCGNHEALHINARYEKDHPGRFYDISKRYPHNEMTRHTAQELQREDLAWMRGLRTITQEPGIMLMHGAPTPYVWGQVGDFLRPYDGTTLRRAWRFMASQNTDIAFVSHAHKHHVFSTPKSTLRTAHFSLPENTPCRLSNGSHHIVTCSAASVPYDGDPRPGWMLYDDEKRTILLRRTTYDISAACKAVEQIGYSKKTHLKLCSQAHNGGKKRSARLS